LIETHRGPLAGLRVLELGPGHSVVPGLLLYAHGAALYVGADSFPIAGRSSALYRRARQHLALRPVLVPHEDLAPRRAEALRRFDEAVDLSKDEAVFARGKVEWRYPVDAATLPFEDASFDLVLSNAAFEHFLDPVSAARESARVLAPGGVGIHQIDLRDHRDFSKPLDFLRYEEAAWRALNQDMVCYTNRLRREGFERAFTGAGLALSLVQTTLTAPVGEAERALFHADFRDRKDLEVLSALFVLKKPLS
jgi:SAM-dependent methyltransferase